MLRPFFDLIAFSFLSQLTTKRERHGAIDSTAPLPLRPQRNDAISFHKPMWPKIAMFIMARFCSGVPEGRDGMGTLGGSGGYRAASTARRAAVGWKS